MSALPAPADDPELRRLMNQARNVLAKGSAFPTAMNLVGWVFALVLVLGLALGIVAVFACFALLSAEVELRETGGHFAVRSTRGGRAARNCDGAAYRWSRWSGVSGIQP